MIVIENWFIEMFFSVLFFAEIYCIYSCQIPTQLFFIKFSHVSDFYTVLRHVRLVTNSSSRQTLY